MYKNCYHFKMVIVFMHKIKNICKYFRLVFIISKYHLQIDKPLPQREKGVMNEKV